MAAKAMDLSLFHRLSLRHPSRLLPSFSATRFSSSAAESHETHMESMIRRERIDYLFKMSCGLAEDGLRDEAIDLFFRYMNGDHHLVVGTGRLQHLAKYGPDLLLNNYHEMAMAGVIPNAYTYAILIKGLAMHDKLEEAKKYIKKMMDNGMKPNASTCLVVIAREKKVEEALQLVARPRLRLF